MPAKSPSIASPRILRSLLRRFLAALAAAGLIAGGVDAATPQLCTGGAHSLALRSDGRVLAWGWDGFGQLGQGRLLFRAAAAQVTSLSGIRSVSSRFGGHALAVASDGRLHAWGSNDNGQLGDGTRIYRGNSVVTALVSGVSAASAGGGFSMALAQDGTVWSWGANQYGMLGDGTTTPRATPARVAGLTDIVAISAANYHALALRRDGTVWAWGRNSYGQLGTGGTTDSLRPVQVPGLTNAVGISAANGWSVAVRGDGTVWAWGRNNLAQLGVAGIPARATPAAIPGLTQVVSVSALGAHGLALRLDSTVWGWGNNGWGQLGLGPGTASATPRAPVAIPSLAGILAISAGDQHSLVLRTDGAVLGFGYNAWGELGLDNARYPYLESPAAIPGASGAAGLNAGFEVSFLVVRGSVVGFGKNNYQQLASGLATPQNQTTPLLVPALDGVASIACGMFASYAVKADGTLWAWGDNEWAAMGDGTFVSRSTPARVAGVPAITRVSAAYSSYASNDEPHHVLALDQSGRVWAWGANTSGQLGTGGGSSMVPVAVTSLPVIAEVAAGAYHSLARDAQGRAWAWGNNGNGELGDGTTTGRTTPVQVPGLATVTHVAAGWNWSLATTADGRAWSWGEDYRGQLGTGASADQHAPVALPTLAGVQAIAAGSDHGLAVLGDGSLWAWGNNGSGAVGDGTGTDRVRPVRIAPAASTLTAVAGNGFSLASIPGGGALAWGFNFNGELGDGTLATRFAPQLVLGAGGSGYLALSLDAPLQVPAGKIAAFPLVASGSATDAAANVSASVTFRAQDQGTVASVYVFALAPPAIVRPAAGDGEPLAAGKAVPREGAKADAPACVLAQLNASGQLQAVSASGLQAYVSGVLSAQGQAVTVLDGVPTSQVAGATFYVGYGANGQAMLDAGTNRSVASIQGSVECKPQAPQTGWWWNPAEGGRGFSIETSGNRLFMAAYLYDVSGRASWLVAGGPTSLDGSIFNARLLSVANGQTLGGPYVKPAPITDEGAVTMAFTDATRGTLVWPGGSIPIERFNIVTGGLAAQPQVNQPESGWWWNAAEDGRGFFIEWQNGWADLAGYMYDDAGNPIWYISVYATPNPLAFGGNWWQYGNGQTLSGAYRPATRVNENVAPVTVQFSGPETAIMTLPGGRTTTLTRYRF